MTERTPSIRKNIYAFDFDSTLGKVGPEIDNQMFVFISRCTGIPIDKVEYLAPRPYSIRTHLENLSNHFSLSDINQTFKEISNFLKYIFRDILYPDTIEVLNKLRDQGSIIGVVTYGGKDYQRLKIVASGLEPIIDFLKITSIQLSKGNYLEQIQRKYPFLPLHYIDDRVEELTSIRDHVSTRYRTPSLIHMRRSSSQDTTNTKLPFPVISTLYQLLDSNPNET